MGGEGVVNWDDDGTCDWFLGGNSILPKPVRV
jgi:hypothetical protein